MRPGLGGEEMPADGPFWIEMECAHAALDVAVRGREARVLPQVLGPRLDGEEFDVEGGVVAVAQ